MKQPALARDLVGVGEFRANLSEWLQRADETGRPVVVTHRGRAAAVLLSPAMHDALQEEQAFMRAVVRGLREARDGRLVDDDEVWAEIDRVLGAAGADPLD